MASPSAPWRAAMRTRSPQNAPALLTRNSPRIPRRCGRCPPVQPVWSEGRLFTTMRRQHLLQMLVALCAVGAVHAEQPDAAQIAQERRQAELDAPKLVEVLELKPGMAVADVGSGFGAMTVVLIESRGACGSRRTPAVHAEWGALLRMQPPL